MLSNWDCESDFLDPMCGSGTILIEAAMYATNYPVNIKRQRFSFMNWKNFDSDLFEMIKKSVLKKVKPFKNNSSGIVGIHILLADLLSRRAFCSGLKR